MIRIVVLSLLLLACNAHAQKTPAIWQELMVRKDLSGFKQYAVQPADRRATGGLDTVFYRSICGDFKEGLFTYEKWLDTALPDGNRSVPYQIRIITKRDKIIYGRLMKIVTREGPDSVRFVETAIYKDPAAYGSLQTMFKQIYKAGMKKIELFRDNIIYGYGCGFGSAPPEEREMMDTLIAHKDKATILSWLQSANTEKKLYGQDACYQLKRQGVPITRLERSLIKIISKKEGTVSGCSGCMVGPGNISYIIPQIKHRPEEIAERTGGFSYEGMD
jgi:hypothetical protein